MDNRELEVSSKVKMLIISEGKKTEPKLFKHLARSFPALNKFNIYSYNTNIYDLYDFLRPYVLDNDLESGDFLQILKEHENDIDKREILSQSYSDILLVFDFDPHDHRYDFNKLEVLLEYFNESTENGKLYLNYPMVESFKHFISVNDENYVERKVLLCDIPNYKSIVSKECGIGNVGDFTKDTFVYVIKANLRKLNYINTGEYNLQDADILDEQLFECAIVQNNKLEESKSCYVLNTGLIFLPQYNSNWTEL